MHAPTILSTTTLLLLSHLAPTQAAPTAYNIYSWFQAHQTTPSLPASTLPSPTTALKYIALGMGTQNYTCASTSATPVAAGAMANLYDATLLLSTNNFIGQASILQLPCLADHIDNFLGMTQIGMHYFNGNGVPNFDMSLGGNGDYLQAKKMGAMAAPTDACTGRSGDAAVSWLYLAQDGSGRSSGLGSVYRVETAGGSAVSCADAVNGWVTRDYAAEYWFYS